MTLCLTCRSEYGHSPACASLKAIAELGELLRRPVVDGDTVRPALLPAEMERYGRSGAEITAEKLGYPPCAGCGNRLIHLPNCPQGKGLV